MALLRVDLGLLGSDPISSDISIPRPYETGSGGPAGLNSTDSSRTGPAPADSGTVDCGPVDSDRFDTGLVDTAQVSSGAAGSGPADTDPVDTDSGGWSADTDPIEAAVSSLATSTSPRESPASSVGASLSLQVQLFTSSFALRVLHVEFRVSSACRAAPAADGLVSPVGVPSLPVETIIFVFDAAVLLVKIPSFTGEARPLPVEATLSLVKALTSPIVGPVLSFETLLALPAEFRTWSIAFRVLHVGSIHRASHSESRMSSPAYQLTHSESGMLGSAYGVQHPTSCKPMSSSAD